MPGNRTSVVKLTVNYYIHVNVITHNNRIK